MDENDKLDPDILLKAIEKEETQQKLGKLKIFFGMSAGVGKTYSMLSEAQEKNKEGVDVVIGIVNTHGRKETEALLKGLTEIPEKWIEYKNTLFKELDLEKILGLKPSIVLIDELAHTNIPGSKHPKRWQDVIELLDAGIDVYTTLNVQHIESRKEIVESITGIPIRENVPDLIFERATEIELIDISPSELLNRLKDGKVYIGEQSQIAAENFFKEDRLTALREIALRFTAEKVEHDLHGILSQGRGWKTRERLMVAISPNIASQQLIRAARKLAFELDASWVVVYVDTGQILNNTEQSMLNKHLNLARDLGAEVVTTVDLDLAAGLHRIAKQKEITRIVIGRSHQKKTIKEYFQKSLFERLEEENEHADVLVLRQDKFVSLYHKTFPTIKIISSANEYWIALGSLVFWSGVSYFLAPILGYKAVGFIFLIGILILSLFVGQGPVFLSALLSAIAWNIFFIPPFLQLHLNSTEDAALVLSFFFTAAIIGLLTSRMRKQDHLLEMREDKIEHLYEIVRDIARAKNFQYLRINVCSRLKTLFKGDFDILTKDTNDQLILESPLTFLTNEKDLAAAQWSFKNGKIAGWSTDTLPSAEGLYLPIKYMNKIMGLLFYKPYEKEFPSRNEIDFLEAVTEQLGVYLDRNIFEQRLQHSDYATQTEKLHESVFSSISAGVYGPIDKIMRINHQLEKEPLNKHVRHLLDEMEMTTESLKLIVDNVLAISKLESGFLHFIKKNHSIRSLLNESLKEIQYVIQERTIEADLPDEDFYVCFDFDLIKLALNNLLMNAIENSPKHSHIEIQIKKYDKECKITINDEGPGIPPDVVPFIFDKFYRVPGSPSKGLGLGLSIVRSIVEIHQGRIKIKSRDEGGTSFSMILPI
ncbi:MAG: ATP-binding protein [Parachlamydiaceae bacterium]|nr:ATP-binding protein [Parachlamydiaceae bacterium]